MPSRAHVSVGKYAARDGRYADVIFSALHDALRHFGAAVGFCKGGAKLAGGLGRSTRTASPLFLVRGLPLGRVLALTLRWLVPRTMLDVALAQPDRRSIHGSKGEGIFAQLLITLKGGAFSTIVYIDFSARSAVLGCRPVGSRAGPKSA